MYEPTHLVKSQSVLTECLLFYRTNLRVACNGFDNAIVTQNNTPIGSNIVYSGEKRTLQVNKDLFDLFLKVGSFSFMETVCAASLISSLVLLCLTDTVIISQLFYFFVSSTELSFAFEMSFWR